MRVRYVVCVSLLFVALALAARSLKTFHDSQTGVSFSYPAAWSDGADVVFYLGSEITTFDEKNGPIPPRAKVGFKAWGKPGPYAGTILDGVQFVYNEIPVPNSSACSKRMTDLDRDEKRFNSVTLNGVTYTHYSGGDAGLGHGAEREIYSTYHEGRCLLFEEAIHFCNCSDPLPKDLSNMQKSELRRQLDMVMRSVQLENSR